MFEERLGRLYHYRFKEEQCELFRRVRAFYVLERMNVLVYADNKIHLLPDLTLVADEVTYFDNSLFRSRGRNYHITSLDEGKLELPWEGEMVKYEKFWYCHIMLFADGELHIEDIEPSLEDDFQPDVDNLPHRLQGVLDYRYSNYGWLYVLYANNTFVAYRRDKQVQFVGQYIKIGAFYQLYHQLYQVEGGVVLCGIGSEIAELTPPLLGAQSSRSYTESLIIGLDGRAHRNDPLMLDRELVFSGVLGYDEGRRLYIAPSIRTQKEITY